MAIRGERFELNLSSDDEAPAVTEPPLKSNNSQGLSFIKDITERDHDEAAPPTEPKLKTTATGFPEHRKRARPSKFKQHSTTKPILPQGSRPPASTTSQTAQDGASRNGFTTEEMERIDEENKERLQNMSDDEIAKERRELLSGLKGSLIETLLKRGNIDEESEDTQELQADTSHTHSIETQPPNQSKKVTFESPGPDHSPPPDEASTPPPLDFDPDAPPLHPPPDLQPASAPISSTTLPLSQKPTIHFPRPPVPNLDPTSSSFLSDLHTKYFPSLPSDPSKLAWMSPLSPDSPSPQYNPQTASLPPSSLRFDFNGNLLPPRLSHQMPSNLGLHHHGDAPEAAGYTIPELAILGRSTVPAQKCVSFQTTGRILYKLGMGVFGDFDGEDGDEGRELCRGLWGVIERERVLDVLIFEAGREEGVGHRSVRALAVEAVWLWRRGGGRRPGKDLDEEGEGRVSG